jgi:hypothetical protein
MEETQRPVDLTDEMAKWLAQNFTMRFPEANDDAMKCIDIHCAAQDFAKVVIQHVRTPEDRDNALRCIREASMWAREGILNYLPPDAQVATLTDGRKMIVY